MATYHANLKDLQQAPRKVRLVADLVRGMKTDDALTALRVLPKKAASPVSKLIVSAVANAKAQGSTADLMISKIMVNDAGHTRRAEFRAFGRINFQKRRRSHLVLELEETKETAKKAASKKAGATKAKKAPAKKKAAKEEAKSSNE